MSMPIVILIALAGIVAGSFIGFSVRRLFVTKKLAASEAKALSLVEEASSRARSRLKEVELEVKEMQFKARETFEREVAERRREIANDEKRLQIKEDNLEKKVSLYETKEETLLKGERTLKEREDKTSKLEKDYRSLVEETRRALERAAGITIEDAKKQLISSLVDEARREAAQTMMKVEEEAKAEAEKKSRYIISSTIERIASEYVSDRSISVVNLPNEEMKGRIIGREGRNIRAFETATGIDVVIDETPEAVVLSGFNPVRREVARITLERLIQDGRIHPTRIEEMVEKVTEEVGQSIVQAGELAFLELKLSKSHPEIVKLVGALKYRYSYAQNVYHHSIEVGHLCGMMASEIGLDERKARRAGLLHDIGKAVTHEMEGAHALIGMDFAKKYKEDEDVAHAIGAHHEDIAQIYPLDCLVDAADAISGARPGARREVLESYVKRMEDLEGIAKSFKGVEKAYAIQAGREIRVMVNFNDISDAQAYILSKDVARKVEQELTFPGQIKVTIIREMRAVEYAK